MVHKSMIYDVHPKCNVKYITTMIQKKSRHLALRLDDNILPETTIQRHLLPGTVNGDLTI